MRMHDSFAPMADMRVLFVLPCMAVDSIEHAAIKPFEGWRRQGVDCDLALGYCRGELLDKVHWPLTHCGTLCLGARHRPVSSPGRELNRTEEVR